MQLVALIKTDVTCTFCTILVADLAVCYHFLATLKLCIDGWYSFIMCELPFMQKQYKMSTILYRQLIHHHSVFCLTTGSKPPPKRFLRIVRSRASSFKCEYPLLSLRLSSSFLCLLPRLLLTSISPFIFPSITCLRRQFLHKM